MLDFPSFAMERQQLLHVWPKTQPASLCTRAYGDSAPSTPPTTTKQSLHRWKHSRASRRNSR